MRWVGGPEPSAIQPPHDQLQRLDPDLDVLGFAPWPYGMALSASRERVRNRVLRQALSPSLLGLAAGLLMSYPIARLIQGRLAGIEIYDPEARVVASFLLIVAVGIATWIPCLRLRDIDLASTLKGE